MRQLQTDWWSLQHGWDDGRAGELVAAIPDLVAEVRALRRQVVEARAWAWSEHHQLFSDRWLGPRSGADDEWRVPDWLASPYEPYQHRWWDAFTDPAAETPRRDDADPAVVVADALRELGRLGFAADRFERRDAALAAVERLRRERDDAQAEAQHWLDMYTARLTAENKHAAEPSADTEKDSDSTTRTRSAETTDSQQHDE